MTDIKDRQTSATTFGLLRHGMTLWNEEKRIQGRCDSPLSESGMEQTRIWSNYLKKFSWDRILASDLGRVKQTVSIVNEKLCLPVTFSQNLREINWGDWEGKKLKDVKKYEHHLLDEQTAAGWKFRAPGGESREEALVRTRLALCEAHKKWPGQKILVICHLGVIKCLLYDAMGKLFLPHEKNGIKKTAFHTLLFKHGRFEIDRINIAPPRLC